MSLLLSEIFEVLEKQPNKQDKIQYLRKNNSDLVSSILRLNYDYNVKFSLPPGEPPFKKVKDKPIGYQETTLVQELRRMYIWVRPDVNLTPFKKESLFINMLEGLHYTEAELICAVKDKQLDKIYKSITEEFVRECFPNLLPPPLPKETPAKKSTSKKSTTSAEAV